MAYVLVTRLICLMFLFILSLYILLVKGYLIFYEHAVDKKSMSFI